MKNKQPKERGFTLIETLIAIFILTLSVTAPIYISSLSFRNTLDSRDNISVQYLAEEVIEVVKNKKDKISLEGFEGYPTFEDAVTESMGSADCFRNTSKPDQVCDMQKNADGSYVFSACPSECDPMFFNPESPSAFYGAEGGDRYSKFTREFYFESQDDGDEIVLTVNTKWKNKSIDRSYTIKESLYKVDHKDFYSRN